MSNSKHLFRGKPKDDSHYYFFKQCWKNNCKDGFVYGSLVADDPHDRYFISVSAMCNRNLCVNNGNTSMIEIIPETAERFTGLTDVNGTKIFEGDIVAFEDVISTENGYYERNCCGEVVWDSEMARFEVTNNLSAESYEVLWECKVIGNIHDNPELLEESEQE